MYRAITLAAMLLAATFSFAQGGSITRQVISPVVSSGGTGQPASFANIRICPASAVGFPCSPLSPTVYADQALTQPLPSAFAADINGNYDVFVPLGVYIVQESNALGAGYTFQYSWLLFVNGQATVSSVGLSLPPSVFSVINSPITTSGTIIATFLAQSAGLVFGNCSNALSVPFFCPLTATMIPGTLNSLTIDGTLTTTATGNTNIGGTLNVAGASTLTGNTTTGGTLGVSGATTLGSTLAVTGNSTIGGSLGVTGALSTGTSFSSPFVNSTNGYQINGSYGTGGQCLSSTGTGTTFTSSCGFGGTPAITAIGGGAGAGGTAILATGSTDKLGLIQVSTGSAPSSAVFIFRLTLSTPFPSFGACTWSQSGGGTTASLIGGLDITNSVFSIGSNGVALGASSIYFFEYQCNGY